MHRERNIRILSTDCISSGPGKTCLYLSGVADFEGLESGFSLAMYFHPGAEQSGATTFGQGQSWTTKRRLLGQSEPAETLSRLGECPRVYVGNLASSVTSSDLLAHFSLAGEVLAALVVTDKTSGLCRGFGFVEMANPADVALAFSLLNNPLLNGQQIKIEADPLLKNGKA